MGWSDVKMRTKLLVLSSLGIIGVVIVGVMGLVTLKHSNNDLKELNNNVRNVALYGEMKSVLLTARLDVILITGATLFSTVRLPLIQL